MELRVGTSGYSYKEWKGAFYPEKTSPKEMLKFYAMKLPSVEINNTFYRLPRADVLTTWAEQVPDDFRFTIKASRRITHLKRLKEVEDETTYLQEILETLGDKLGVILFQLPPNFKKDLERLERFIGLLTDGTKAVFEFRHESWFDEEVYDSLRTRRCALCLADVDDEPAPELVPTAGFGYLRLRRAKYTKPQLVKWAKLVGEQDWKEAYIYFKHEDEGSGPEMAQRFLEIASA